MERYCLIRPLGSGGTSRVFLGMDPQTGGRYAVKRYECETALRSAEEEIRLLKKLDHPSIPKVREIFCEEGVWYVVMEYMPGITMKEHLRRVKRIPEADAARWGMELCEILSCLHSQCPPVIYRDLKPSNIIVSPLSTLCLIDFGAAAEGNRETYVPIGTPGYAAPEQFERSGRIDERTDIYALGATLYYMLTGNMLLQGGTAWRTKRRELRVSVRMRQIIEQCMAAEPENRYRFCAEVKEELKNRNRRVPKRTLRIDKNQTNLDI